MKKLFSLLTLFLIFSCGGNPHESSKSIIQEGINNITKMDYDAYIELISPENREDIRERVLKMTEKDKKKFSDIFKDRKIVAERRWGVDLPLIMKVEFNDGGYMQAIQIDDKWYIR
jgi:hypothetical protein